MESGRARVLASVPVGDDRVTELAVEDGIGGWLFGGEPIL